MKTKELRIGNYLHDRNGRLCKVTELNETDFKACALKEAITSLPHKPITLTVERLIKAGVVVRISEISKCGHAYIGLLSLWIDNGKIYYSLINRLVRIETVHQLQNLYYELTGEELEIKL